MHKPLATFPAQQWHVTSPIGQMQLGKSEEHATKAQSLTAIHLSSKCTRTTAHRLPHHSFGVAQIQDVTNQ